MHGTTYRAARKLGRPDGNLLPSLEEASVALSGSLAGEHVGCRSARFPNEHCTDSLGGDACLWHGAAHSDWSPRHRMRGHADRRRSTDLETPLQAGIQESDTRREWGRKARIVVGIILTRECIDLGLQPLAITVGEILPTEQCHQKCGTEPAWATAFTLADDLGHFG